MNTMTDASARTLECGHVFHKACLERWRRQSSTCPNCRAPFDQQTYKVRVTIEPIGYDHEMITSNVQTLSDMFGLDETMERFFSTINFTVTNMNDLRNVLNEIGFPGMDFPGLHTES